MTKQYKNPGPIIFTGVIQRNTEVDNSSAWIEFPHDLKETYGVGNLVPFKATFDGRVSYRGSLAKMGGTKAMVLLRKDVRAELAKEPGQTVEAVIELDDAPRELAVPDYLKTVLTKEGLQEAFAKLSYTRRKEQVASIDSAKRPETRAKRLEQLLELLHEETKN